MLRLFPRVFHCSGMQTRAAARPSQAESQAQRSVSGRNVQTDSDARAPQTVRSDSTNVVISDSTGAGRATRVAGAVCDADCDLRATFVY